MTTEQIVASVKATKGSSVLPCHRDGVMSVVSSAAAYNEQRHRRHHTPKLFTFSSQVAFLPTFLATFNNITLQAYVSNSLLFSGQIV